MKTRRIRRRRQTQNQQTKEKKQAPFFDINSGDKEAQPFFSPDPAVQAKSEEELPVQAMEEEETMQAMEEEDETMQAMEEEETMQAMKEEDETMQAMEEEEDETMQAMEEEEETMQAMEEEDETMQAIEEEEETMQAMEEEESLQAKADSKQQPSAAYAKKLAKTKGGGNPLPKDTLEKMNKSFKTDFSKVRIHTGKEAAELAAEIGAQAFTNGTDIYFNEGKFAPNSNGGQALLAHELAHVMQQR